MTTELRLVVVGWGAWLAIGLFLGAAIERRRPWTGGLWLSASLLALEVAVARTAAALAPAPRAQGAWRAVMAFVVVELAMYATHRAMHRVPALWRFHRLHHRPVALRWHHAWRRHPVDDVLFALTSAAAIGAIGATPWSVAVVVVLRRAWTIVLHAELAWPWSRVDRWFATPAFHRRHHDEAAAAANFAPTLAVIDRIFGTASRPR